MGESSPKRQRTASNIVSLDIVSRGLSLVDGNGNGLLCEVQGEKVGIAGAVPSRRLQLGHL